MKILSSEKGAASAIAIFALAGAVGIAFMLSKKMGKLNEEAITQSKQIRISPIKEKITRLGGFLISSNLILCRNNEWLDGGKANTCRWNSKNYAGASTTYSPEDFQLQNERSDSGELIYDVNVEKLFEKEKKRGLLTGKMTNIKFKLVNSEQLKFNLGKLTGEQAENDKDTYLIVMEGSIGFKDIGKKEKITRFKAAFRRPISVPKVEVTSSSCAQRCDVSLSENPSPACRSSFYIDEETMTDVEAVTTNLGPGALYDLVYERSVAFKEGASLKEGVGEKTPVNINVDDYVVPGGNKKWADTFPCATMSESKTVTKTVFAPTQLLRYLGAPLLPMRILFPDEAFAQWVQVQTGSTTTSELSQHSNPAGTIIYQVGGENSSTLEPYRMTAPITPVPQSFKGLMNTTTTTNFYTWVYVDPPH